MNLSQLLPAATFSRSTLLVAVAALGLLGSVTGCATKLPKPLLRTVPYVDLDRYAGRWYVIANIPYFLEKGKVASYDTYTKRPDGKFDNTFTFRKGSLTAPEKSWHGKAKIENTATNAEWSVQFIWPISTPYLVIDLDPDYKWAVVGHPSRDLFWILARERQLPDDVYAGILQRAATQGYDPSRVVKVLQPAP